MKDKHLVGVNQSELCKLCIDRWSPNRGFPHSKTQCPWYEKVTLLKYFNLRTLFVPKVLENPFRTRLTVISI